MSPHLSSRAAAWLARTAALCALCSALLPAARAAACGASADVCVEVLDVQPEDGALGVPTNTELRVQHTGVFECDAFPRRALRLVRETGHTQQLWAQARGPWLVARPPEPLLPSTRYALQVPLGSTSECHCEELEWTTIAEFTTGTSQDVSAPGFGGIESVDYRAFSEVSNNCGFEFAGHRVIGHFDVAVDDRDADFLRFDQYVDGEPVRRYLREPEIPWYACDHRDLAPGEAAPPGMAVEVRAVDLAGNESAAHEPFVYEARCGREVDARDDDAGVDDAALDGAAPDASTADAGLEDAGQSQYLGQHLEDAARGADGCSLAAQASAHRGTAPLAYLLAGIFLLASRRRAALSRARR